MAIPSVFPLPCIGLHEPQSKKGAKYCILEHIRIGAADWHLIDLSPRLGYKNESGLGQGSAAS
jgi:hypothetical protein